MKISKYKKPFLERLEDYFITQPKSPFAATALEWDTIHKDQKNNHPIAFFIFNDIGDSLRHYNTKIKDLIWFFRYRLCKKHRYNIVYTGLKPSYYEIDHRLLFSSFALLQSYVDTHYDGIVGIKKYHKLLKKQQPLDNAHIQATQETIELYTWWVSKRKKDHDALQIVCDSVKAVPDYMMLATNHDYKKHLNKISRMEEKLYNIDTNNLIRLCGIRKYLW